MAETRHVSVEVAAPPERLWSMVSDITRMGEWSPENVGGEWLDGATGPALGARFRGKNRRRVTWSTTCTVEAAEPGSEFAFRTSGRPPTRWRYGFTPTPSGTRVDESFELGRPLTRFDRVLTRVTTGIKHREDDMEDGMRQTLARLKAAAEAGSE